MKFEEAVLKLNEIVEKLESGELSLEDSIKIYQEGIELSMSCKKEIEKAKVKITQFNDEKIGNGEI